MHLPLLPRGVIAAALALGLAGCPPAETGEGSSDAGDAGADGPIGCKLAFLGDPAKDIELELIALDADYHAVKVADGDAIALMFPPQGGRVIFAGVRATNVDPCAVKITGALRDLATQQVRVDTRTVNLEAQEGGWGASADDDIASFSNIPICPNQWSETDVYGADYELSVTLTERSKRAVTVTRTVKPACSEPAYEAECRCICRGGYKLGETCADAGVAP